MVAVQEVKQDSLPRSIKRDEDKRTTMSAVPGSLACKDNPQVLRASAKAAEERLYSLLDERTRFHAKLEEALRQGNTDRVRLQQLLDLEKSKHESSKKELEKIQRSFESFWKTGLGANAEKDIARDTLPLPKASLQEDHHKKTIQMEAQITTEQKAAEYQASVKAAEERLNYLLDEKAQLHEDYEKKLEESHLDRLRLRQLLEIEKSKHEAYQKELEVMKHKVEGIMSKDVKGTDVESKLAGIGDTLLRNSKFGGDGSQSDSFQSERNVSNNEMDSFDLSFNRDMISINQNMAELNEVKRYKKMEVRAKSEVLKLVKEQEAAWKKAEDAVDNLERRLILLENEKFKLEEAIERMQLDARSNNNAEDIFTKLERSPCEEDLAKHYNCIYVSPIFEDRKGSVVHRPKAGQDRHGLRQKAITSEQLDSRKDLEIQELKAEIQKLRIQGYENERSRKAEVLYDKANSSRIPISLPGTHGEKHLGKAEETTSFAYSVHGTSTSEASGGSLNTEEERWSIESVHCRLSMNECAPNGFMKVMKEKLAGAKRENGGPLFFVTDQHEKNFVHGRSTQVPETLELGDLVTKTVRAPLVAMQDSLKKVSNNMSGFGNGDSQPIELNKGSLEGELHLLKKTLHKLEAICQEQGNKFSSCKVLSVGGENCNLQALRDFYFDLLSEMMKPLDDLNQELSIGFALVNNKTESTWKKQLSAAIEESDNLKVALESTRRHLEQEKIANKLLAERLGNEEKHLATMVEEHRVELERKEKTLSYAQQLNSQLANDMSKTETTLAELRSRYKGLVASLENQLKDAHNDLESLQDKADRLTQQLVNSEAKAVALEHSLEDKDKQMEEVKRRMQAIQNETDATVIEKFELVTKMQDKKKESDEQKQRITELVSINEELLGFAQAKEDQLASLNQEAVRLLQIVKVKSVENTNLMQELEDTRKEVNDLREEDDALKRRYKFMKSKLYDTEYELAQREEALERLTKHLAATIEGQDCVFDEAEQLNFSLKNASNKEQKLGGQLKQSRILIDELEEKMACMEAEVLKARKEMANMKELNSLVTRTPGQKGQEASWGDETESSVARR